MKTTLALGSALSAAALVATAGASAALPGPAPASATTVNSATYAAPAAAAPAAAAAIRDLHVRTTGNDSANGSATAPVRTIQRAADLATPGTRILVHAGTYTGQVTVRTTGTASAPITLTTAGDGAVTVTSSPPAVSCGSNKPAGNRTIMIGGGVDYWTISGLRIVNGVYISGKDSNSAYTWHANLVKAANWSPRRAAPGRGVNNPAASRTELLSYLKARTGKPDLNPSDGIKLLSNTITGRGIHASYSRFGQITGNNIGSISCGTGPGIWLITFSDGWTVSNNSVHDVAPSTAAHFMQEGIRLGTASNYNLVTGNTVSNLPGDGRAFNTDVDASYNTFSRNVARNVAMGFNEQMSGWGNVWSNNQVSDYRNYGYALRLKDGNLVRPSMDTSSNHIIMTCNVASAPSGNARALGIGSMNDGTFTNNTFTTVYLSGNVRNYWTSTSSLWNGSTAPPSATPPVPAGARSC